MSETEHSPTPWRVVSSDSDYAYKDSYLLDATGDAVIWSQYTADYGLSQADAEYIVRLVNADHEARSKDNAVRAVVALLNSECSPGLADS